jgi:hypothetical protein
MSSFTRAQRKHNSQTAHNTHPTKPFESSWKHNGGARQGPQKSPPPIKFGTGRRNPPTSSGPPKLDLDGDFTDYDEDISTVSPMMSPIRSRPKIAGRMTKIPQQSTFDEDFALSIHKGQLIRLLICQIDNIDIKPVRKNDVLVETFYYPNSNGPDDKTYIKTHRFEDKDATIIVYILADAIKEINSKYMKKFTYCNEMKLVTIFNEKTVDVYLVHDVFMFNTKIELDKSREEMTYRKALEIVGKKENEIKQHNDISRFIAIIIISFILSIIFRIYSFFYW